MPDSTKRPRGLFKAKITLQRTHFGFYHLKLTGIDVAKTDGIECTIVGEEFLTPELARNDLKGFREIAELIAARTNLVLAMTIDVSDVEPRPSITAIQTRSTHDSASVPVRARPCPSIEFIDSTPSRNAGAPR
jgi:hypothetical protein